jgi:lupus La protein
MWELHTKDENHWVPLQTVANFHRMRRFLEFGIDWIADRMKDSTQLQLKDEKEGDQTVYHIRRKFSLTKPPDDMDRSVYAVRTTLFHPVGCC